MTKKIRARLDEGMSTADVAKFVGVTQRSIQLWKKADRNQEKRSTRPEMRLLTLEHEKGVLQHIAENPDVVLEQIVEFVLDSYSVVISRFTASRILKRHKITRKRGARMNHRYVLSKGLDFLDCCVRPLYGSQLVSIEEMSVTLNVASLYVYALRGQRAVLSQPSRRTVSFMLKLCVDLSGVIHWSLDNGGCCEESPLLRMRTASMMSTFHAERVP